MKAIAWSIGLVAALQGVPPQSPPKSPAQQPPDTLRVMVANVTCVPTEPMPIIRLDSAAMARYRMPVIRPDLSRLARGPIAQIIPCYQVDTSVGDRPRTIP